MTTPTRAALLARLNGLKNDRLSYEMSSSFAYSNGTIGRIDDEIREVRKALAQIEQVAA
jgi:hypothetical protein